MYFTQTDISFQEVPNEVSLIFSISGCPHRCPGCHSIDLWKERFGSELSMESFLESIKKYNGLVTCICFFGGDWEEASLVSLLKKAINLGLKTCLYSGNEYVSTDVERHLDYLKIGPWKQELGGLESKDTNQQFINVKTKENLNHFFQKTHTEVANA